MVGALRSAALRSISACCDADSPSARCTPTCRQRVRPARRPARRAMAQARDRSRASRRIGGPSPPGCLVSDGGSRTITPQTLSRPRDQAGGIPGAAACREPGAAAKGSTGGRRRCERIERRGRCQHRVRRRRAVPSIGWAGGGGGGAIGGPAASGPAGPSTRPGRREAAAPGRQASAGTCGG